MIVIRHFTTTRPAAIGLLLLVLTFALAACQQAGAPEEEPNAPEVINTTPSDGASNVTTGVSVRISFSTEMDPASTEAAVSIDPAVGCDFSWNAALTTLSCAPQPGWDTSTTYEVTVSTGAQSAEGIALEEEFVLTFTTGFDFSP